MSLISSTMLSLDSVVSLNNVVPRIWAEVEKDSDGLGLYARPLPVKRHILIIVHGCD